MGIWGTKLYENDVALDVRDELEVVFQGGSISDVELSDKCKSIIRALDSLDDRCIAYLVIADYLVARGKLTHWIKDEALKSCESLFVAEAFDQSTISSIKKRLLSTNAGTSYSSKSCNNYCLDKCSPGDVYVYTVKPQYATSSQFAYGKIGIIIYDVVIFNKKKCPLVSFFIGDIEQHSILANDFSRVKPWPTANEKEFGFVYRTILYGKTRKDIPNEQLYYCGKLNHIPCMEKEFVPLDKSGFTIFRWNEIEERLLMTNRLMEYGLCFCDKC